MGTALLQVALLYTLAWHQALQREEFHRISLRGQVPQSALYFLPDSCFRSLGAELLYQTQRGVGSCLVSGVRWCARMGVAGVAQQPSYP